MQAKRKRPVVIGASGSLGSLLLAEARARGLNPVATARAKSTAMLLFDALRDDLLDVVPDLGSDDCVYLAFGLANPNWVHAHPAESRAVNVDATIRVLDQVLERRARAVFLSSEMVFDGQRGGYDESSAPNPVTEYGRQKVDVERHLLEREGDWVIVRMGATVTEGVGENCVVEKTYTTLLQPDARMAPDNVISLTPARGAIAALLMLQERGERGVYHLVAEPPVTRVELASWIMADSRFAARMAFSEIAYGKIAFPEPRPARSYIVGSHTRQRLGVKFSPTRDAVRQKVALLDADFETELAGTVQ